MLQEKKGKTQILLSIFAFAAMLIFAVSLSAQNQYTISGKVTASDDGTALSSILVIYSSEFQVQEPAPLMKILTDSEGNYSILLKSGTFYKLQAYPMNADYLSTFNGNAVSLNEAAAIELNSDITGVDFALVKKQIYDNGFHGFVRNADGEGVPAKVTAIPVNQSYPSISVSTDMNTGVFNFTNLIPGDYFINAIPEIQGLSGGFYSADGEAISDMSLATAVTVSETGINPVDYTIILPKADPAPKFYGVTGAIVDNYNQPLANVKISATDFMGQELNTITDEKGNFIINITIGGKYQLTAAKDGYDQGFSSFIIDENSPNQAVNLVLNKTETTKFNNGIKGIVKNSDGEGLWAQITAFRVEMDGKNMPRYNAVRSAPTSKINPGEFELTDLTPGNYVLYAAPASSAPGYYNGGGGSASLPENAAVITVADEGTNSIDYIITLPDNPHTPVTWTITGSVVSSDNTTLEGVSIAVNDENGNALHFSKEIVSDNAGSFELALPAGFYTITGSKDGFIENSITLNTADKNAIYLKVSLILEPVIKDNPQSLSGVTDNIISGDSFNIYPNPASDKLTVNLPDISGDCRINVFDINGDLVQSSSVNASGVSTASINISSLPVGCYFIKVINSGMIMNVKMFVKK